MVITLSTNNLSNTARAKMPKAHTAAFGSDHRVPLSCLQWWS